MNTFGREVVCFALDGEESECHTLIYINSIWASTICFHYIPIRLLARWERI